MTPERWARLQAAFSRVVEAPAQERGNALAAACGDDLELRQEVEAMLATDEESDQQLRQVIGGAVTEVVAGERNRLIGSVLGSYRITGVLGYGGMGTVYLAERADRQYKQKVAIKLVQQMAVHPQLRTRLRAERQILASLDHPSIARLIDGGETAEGVPFLVIEYIDGKPIDEYCDEQRLDVRARLRLFEKVCGAVDYAHRNLIVHRDLKPGNILVTAEGNPKLLDFGIAKLLNPEPASHTVAVTRIQDRLLTPEHASPEQVLGRTITIASDVYTLGVLLFELLCGRSPYAAHNSTALGLERAICNEDPPRPSSLFRTKRASPLEGAPFDAAEVASRRGVSADKLRRQLVGDLDEIVLKAMRKEPQARYATAAQLADDLRRYLDGEPVIARQGSRRYRTIKFMRRNAMAVSLATLALASLVAFSSMMYLQKQRLAEQKEVADRERDTANTVSAFLVDIFSASDPFKSQGTQLTARELLERGADRIKSDLNEQPEVRARMLESIGYAYQRQGDFAHAIPLLEQSLQIRRQTDAEPNALLATSLLNLADALRMGGNTASAEGYYRQALELNRQLFGPDHERVAATMVGLGRLFQGGQRDLEEAEQLFRGALRIYKQRYGPDHPEVAATLSDLANLALWRDDLQTAEREQREALRIYQASVPRTHPDYCQALGSLGLILMKRGNLDEAEKLLSESLSLHYQVFGRDSPRLASVLDALATLRERRGQYPAAIELVKEALAVTRHARGERTVEAAYYLQSLASLQLKTHNAAGARATAEEALGIFRQSVPPDHLYIASSEQTLAEILLAQGKLSEAEAMLRDAVAIWSKNTGANSWRTARSQSTLGAVLAGLGKDKDAEVLLVNSHRTLLEERGPDDELTRVARQRVLDFLAARHRSGDAKRLLNAS